MASGLARGLLSDKGEQFTSRFFQNFCEILRIENVITATYHPQINGKAKRYSPTIISGLCHYVKRQPTEWNVYTNIFTYGFNSQINRIINCTISELVPLQPPHANVMQPTAKDVQTSHINPSFTGGSVTDPLGSRSRQTHAPRATKVLAAHQQNGTPDKGQAQRRVVRICPPGTHLARTNNTRAASHRRWTLQSDVLECVDSGT